MSDDSFDRWRPHPWHGLSVGPNPPETIHAYIEITPSDTVKYEVDKESGYLRVDRPQRYSSQPPALYGFVPRTYCADKVDELSPQSDRGDHDPLDVCVLSERSISRAEVLLNARLIGGLRMIDHGEADDKIIAVLENDNVWGSARDLSDVPKAHVERLRHYFLTYKAFPEHGSGDEAVQDIDVDYIYGRDHAFDVLQASMEDYELNFGDGAEDE